MSPLDISFGSASGSDWGPDSDGMSTGTEPIRLESAPERSNHERWDYNKKMRDLERIRKVQDHLETATPSILKMRKILDENRKLRQDHADLMALNQALCQKLNVIQSANSTLEIQKKDLITHRKIDHSNHDLIVERQKMEIKELKDKVNIMEKEIRILYIEVTSRNNGRPFMYGGEIGGCIQDFRPGARQPTQDAQDWTKSLRT